MTAAERDYVQAVYMTEIVDRDIKRSDDIATANVDYLAVVDIASGPDWSFWVDALYGGQVVR